MLPEPNFGEAGGTNYRNQPPPVDFHAQLPPANNLPPLFAYGTYIATLKIVPCRSASVGTNRWLQSEPQARVTNGVDSLKNGAEKRLILICPCCPYTFDSLYALTKHFKEQKKATHPISRLNADFESLFTAQHMNYQCAFCALRFAKAYDVESHLIRDECQYAERVKYALAKHFVLRIPDAGQAKRKCEDYVGWDILQNQQQKEVEYEVKVPHALSYYCSKGDYDVLDKEIAVLNSSLLGPNDPVYALNRLIGSCRRLEKTEREPYTEDSKLVELKQQLRFNTQMSNGKLCRALDGMEEEVYNVNNFPLQEANHPELMEKYFPRARVLTHYPLQWAAHSFPAIVPPTAAQIRGLIHSSKNNRAPGPSGIANEHWKYLSRRHHIEKPLALIFKALLEEPENAKKIPYLFEFRVAFLKKSYQLNDCRPIAIEESLLLMINRYVANYLRSYLEFDVAYCAYKKQGPVVSAFLANEQLEQHRILTRVDISNAFNSIYHNVLLAECRAKGMPESLINYLSGFLQQRHTARFGQISCGIPQEDPLSSVLFCTVFDTVLRQFRQLGATPIAYLDDLVLSTYAKPNKNEIIRILDSVCLSINEDKYESSTDVGGIRFVGYEFGEQPTDFATLLMGKLARLRDLFERSKLGSIHYRYLLFSKLILQRVNFGPFADVYTDKQHSYLILDDEITGFCARILYQPFAGVQAIMTRAPEHGGLGLVLPGVFYPQMLAAKKTFLNSGIPVFKQLRADVWRYLAPVAYPVRLSYALNSSRSMPDTGLKILLDNCFYPTLSPLEEQCDLCGKPSYGEEHVAFCTKYAGLWTVRHDAIALQLQQSLSCYRARKLTIADAVGEKKTFADIRVEMGVNVFDIDVTVTVEHNFAKRFAYKVAKHTHPMEGRMLTVVPVVCSPFGKLYDRSKYLLQLCFPELKLDKFHEVLVQYSAQFWVNALAKQAKAEEKLISEQIEKIAAAVGYDETEELFELV